jgi:hypothetical protein
VSIVSDAVIAEWVINTIQCAEMLKFDRDVTVAQTRDEIYDFLIPITTKPDVKGEGELSEILYNLCEDAFKLRMTMRKSKEGYRCELPKVENVADSEDIVDSMGVEGGGKNKDASDTIAYVLFGALIKHPQYRGEDRRVLEKAHVIVKQRERESTKAA